MRFPKKVTICGKTYTVRQDKAIWGGNGGTGRQEIVVGTHKDQTAERKFENFIHEVAELTAAEQHVRYEAADDEIMFVMNHKQFDKFANGIAAVLCPMVKGK